MPFWVKRDDKSSRSYGGNKVRKLRGILAAARRDRIDCLVTAGAWGSHHVLATAIHAARQGIAVVPVLFPQPTSPYVQRNRARIHAIAAGVVSAPHAAALPFLLPPAWARARRLGRVRWVPLGGSSVVGMVGYVEAAHELAAQVTAGVCPRPDAIFLPLGTGGTAAGLWVGLAEAFPRPPCVVAVRVVERLVSGRGSIRRLARKLRRARPCRRALGRLRVVHGFAGASYGARTRAGDGARRQHPGLALEHTYGAKTLAALLALGRGELAGRELMFLHTAPHPV